MASLGIIIYTLAMSVFALGLLMLLLSDNLVYKIIGLAVFQSSVLLFYIAMGKARQGLVPIAPTDLYSYSSPLPHVLMLTAIVVGFATMSVALALIVQIKKAYGNISQQELTEHVLNKIEKKELL